MGGLQKEELKVSGSSEDQLWGPHWEESMFPQGNCVSWGGRKDQSFPLRLRVWGSQEGELRSSCVGVGVGEMLPGFFWAQSLKKSWVPSGVQKRKNWGAEGSEGEVRGAVGPPTFTERDQRSPGWGSEQGSWGPAGIPERECGGFSLALQRGERRRSARGLRGDRGAQRRGLRDTPYPETREGDPGSALGLR